MKHDLKIRPEYFEHVENGNKTFEIRLNDRGFQTGDLVLLEEYDPEYVNYGIPPGKYTGRKLYFKIGYVYPIENNHVIFSLLPPKESDFES